MTNITVTKKTAQNLAKWVGTIIDQLPAELATERPCPDCHQRSPLAEALAALEEAHSHLLEFGDTCDFLEREGHKSSTH